MLSKVFRIEKGSLGIYNYNAPTIPDIIREALVHGATNKKGTYFLGLIFLFIGFIFQAFYWDFYLFFFFLTGFCLWVFIRELDDTEAENRLSTTMDKWWDTDYKKAFAMCFVSFLSSLPKKYDDDIFMKGEEDFNKRLYQSRPNRIIYLVIFSIMLLYSYTIKIPREMGNYQVLLFITYLSIPLIMCIFSVFSVHKAKSLPMTHEEKTYHFLSEQFLTFYNENCEKYYNYYQKHKNEKFKNVDFSSLLIGAVVGLSTGSVGAGLMTSKFISTGTVNPISVVAHAAGIESADAIDVADANDILDVADTADAIDLVDTTNNVPDLATLIDQTDDVNTLAEGVLEQSVFNTSEFELPSTQDILSSSTINDIPVFLDSFSQGNDLTIEANTGETLTFTNGLIKDNHGIVVGSFEQDALGFSSLVRDESGQEIYTVDADGNYFKDGFCVAHTVDLGTETVITDYRGRELYVSDASDGTINDSHGNIIGKIRR